MVIISHCSPPTQGIKHLQPCTTLHINNRRVGQGTLFITESSLSWINSSSDQGFSLDYPNICLHAVSRDLQVYPHHECLYMMLDTSLDALEVKSSEDSSDDSISENDDNESSSNMTELRFVPDDKGVLDAMFHAMSECQALHPDPNDFSEDDEAIFEDAEDDDEGEYETGDGDSVFVGLVETPFQVAHNGSNAPEPMDMDEGQFEDAED